jgi:ribosomal protein S18 acetylase RimI-like enzyme
MLVIDQARPDEWVAAFELAYQRTPTSVRQLQVMQALHLLETGFLDPQGIWVARRGASVCGVQTCVPLGGASFLFWLPETRFVPGTADLVIEAALAWCREQKGKLAQAIVAPADAARAAPLLRHGFAHVAQILYLEHDLQALPAVPVSPLPVHCEPYGSANETPFRAALARTYESTLDCPELNGVRSIDEILASYQAARAGRQGPWWLIRAGDNPIGVVIITELSEAGVWDFSYIGIVPEHRGKGVARIAACRALAAAHAASAHQMVLAVDVRNSPARRLYQSLGFVEREIRDVYLHFLAGPPAPSPP